MDNRRFALLTVLILTAMMFAVPASDSDAYGTGDLEFSVVEGDSISIDAMSSMHVYVDVSNKSDTVYDIKAVFQSGYSGLYVKESVYDVTVHPLGHQTLDLVLYTAKYVEAGIYDCKVHIEQYTPGNTSLPSVDVPLKVSVHSYYGTDSQFNHIMGKFDNPLPAPLDSPFVTAMISLVIWLIIAYVISLGATVVFGKLIIGGNRSTEEQDNYAKLKGLWKFLFIIIIMHGITECLNIAGVNESVIGSVADLTSILFTLCGAMIVWTLFRTFVVEMGIKKMDEDYALTPLILMIGKIVIFSGTAVTTLAVFGINLVSLITAMGLVTTGISLGAKNVIGQFISGLIILIERPFVIGDKIKVGGDREVLVVRNIGFMTTTFKKWTNEEIYVIPNSVLMDSQMINITRDNINYKVYDYYTIDHDSDISRAREILLQCAYEHPGVVTEGAFGKPDVKFYAIDLTQITLRLSFTVSDHENFGVYAGEIRKRVFETFNEEGISIPFTQVTANIIKPKLIEGSADPDGLQ